ncbi:hypothetical protein I4I73_29005 [Pseudonocardia sp. KRD-184]|uniref:Uncharacterized protein n=1 Tax=Pseudonocardia oceani TaxID=2792013 RepID=A0ABS6UG13_9PSEU|nr:hypothetical protein [Pseudonocardia oceani]MBW0088214.1 hypothetical protein [Pseudonocardia oceani]MBW0100024.1 hypothetical protein [Pseudonocardia oceani]MBW0121151.1 hypothetical protein [Pseudonocardia oceani]MBW0131163.1 hypothetical protein [Pseudonocardia oceani]MBW0132575.1 hypothetical protein [Pseudonocardia oceani]
MGEQQLMGPVRAAEARDFQATYLADAQPEPVPLPPQRRELTEAARIRDAMAVARRLYSGAVRDLLIGELQFHMSNGYRVNQGSLPARLVTELLDQADTR